LPASPTPACRFHCRRYFRPPFSVSPLFTITTFSYAQNILSFR
jgi:hypothetical protein